MKPKLCCLIDPRMKCGFCNIPWCQSCWNEMNDNDKWTRCPVPNNSGSDQGNHFTMDFINDEWTDVDLDLHNVRRLVDGEKPTDFDGENSVL